MIGHGTTATDSVTAVTYGGVSLTRVRSDSEATEAGRVYLYWGRNIPGGTQNVVVTHSTSTVRIAVGTMTVAAGNVVALAGNATGTSASASNPTWNMTTPTGVSTLCFLAIHSGLQTMTNTPTSPFALVVSGALGTGSAYDAGTDGRGFATGTASGGTVACGWTAATADDFVGSSVAFREFPMVNQVTETDTAQPIDAIKTKWGGGKGVVRYGRERGRFPAREAQWRPVKNKHNKFVFAKTTTGNTNVNVGQATETDTAQPIGRLKSQTLGQNTETDTPQTIARLKSKAVGQNTETDTTQPISRLKSRAVAQATETDLSQPISKLK
jgi:hypothetical protein